MILTLYNILGALTERSLLDATLGLARRGFDLTIGYESRASECPALPCPSVQLKRICVDPEPDIPAQMRRIAEQVTEPAMVELLRRKVDLVHGHFGPRILQGAAWMARGTPMIVSTYGYDVGRLLRDPCWIERYRWAADHGAVFVALARFMEEKLLFLGLPADRVRRIHLGINLAEHPFRPTPAPSRPRFVFIGRFVDKKGADVLIDAMAHLVRVHHADARLDLIGAGPNEPALRAQVTACRLEDHVHFIGVVPFAHLFQHLRDCTALVQPSVTAADGDAEGAPMVLMTAQAFGVPCITTHHSGNPETIPPIGQRFIVPERQSILLAQAMSEMSQMAGSDRMLLQEAGRDWIATHFNLERTVSAYADLYGQIVRA